MSDKENPNYYVDGAAYSRGVAWNYPSDGSFGPAYSSTCASFNKLLEAGVIGIFQGSCLFLN